MTRRISFSLSDFRVIVLVGLVSLLSRTGISADAPLPALEDVLARIEQTEALIQTLQVHEVSETRQRDRNGRAEVYAMDRVCDWTLTTTGKRHYIATGETLRFTNEGVVTHPFKVEMAFDGKVARSLEYFSRDLTQVFSGQVADHPSRHSMLPLNFTVFWDSETLREILQKRTFAVIGFEPYQERNVVHIEGEPIERNGWFWSRRVLFDMQRGSNVKTAYIMKKRLDDEWIEYASWSGFDYIEAIPGVWLPTRYRKFSFSVKEDGTPKEFSSGFIGTYSDWKVNEPIPDERFTLTFPGNIPVNDQRFGGNGKLLGKDEIRELNAQLAN